jgi:AcrR family transcriptional regulator
MSEAESEAIGDPDSAAARRARPLRQAQKELTRSRLLEAGLEVFLERGYEAATVDEIADRANVGRTTFYSHFQSKTDVATAVALAETGPLNVAVAELGDADPSDRVSVGAWLARIEQQFLEENTVVTLVMQHIEVAQEFMLIQRRSADEALAKFEAAGWTPSVVDAPEHLRLLFMLVNRWVYLHIVQGIPLPDSSRNALVELIQTHLRLILQRKNARRRPS